MLECWWCFWLYWYSYALNNPLIYTDPTGYSSVHTIIEELMNSEHGGHWTKGDEEATKFKSGGDASQYHNSLNNPVWGFNFGFTPGTIGFRTGLIGNPYRPQIRLPKFNLSFNFQRYEYVGDLMESGFPELADISWIHRSIDYIYGETDGATRSGNDIISSYPDGYSFTSFERKPGELKQWNPSGVHRWSRSSNFFASLSYDLVNGISVTAQSFLRGPNSVHLTGELVKGNDRVDAFVNTASWALLAGEASTFNTTKTGIGVYSTRWRLRVQFHRHGISPLKGRGATGKMYPFHLNINNTHIIFNPKYWKYFY